MRSKLQHEIAILEEDRDKAETPEDLLAPYLDHPC